MNQKLHPIFIGNTRFQQSNQDVSGEFVSILGDVFYKIKNFDSMPPFFMSIVSSSNHWLFISSTGGLSAGRVSAEQLADQLVASVKRAMPEGAEVGVWLSGGVDSSIIAALARI